MTLHNEHHYINYDGLTRILHDLIRLLDEVSVLVISNLFLFHMLYINVTYSSTKTNLECLTTECQHRYLLLQCYLIAIY
jgi:hypothetical protein